MEIFEKKTNTQHKRAHVRKKIHDKEALVTNNNKNIAAIEKETEETKEANPVSFQKPTSKKDRGISLSSRTKQALAKLTSYAGIISLMNSTGNACKGIASNPFLLALGIGLLVTSVGMFLWSFFK